MNHHLKICSCSSFIDNMQLHAIKKKVARVQDARLSVLNCVDRDLQSHSSLLTVSWLSSPIEAHGVLEDISRWPWCVMRRSISVRLKFAAQRFSF